MATATKINLNELNADGKPRNARCSRCLEVKNAKTHFHTDNSPDNASGHLLVCKKCLQEVAFANSDTLTAKGMFDVCKLVNKPFYKSIFDKVQKRDISEVQKIGEYFKYVCHPENESKGFADGEQPVFYSEGDAVENALSQEELAQCQELFGDGFATEDYRRALALYKKMLNNYPLKTVMHQQILADWAMTKAFEQKAMAAGNVEEAEKWGKRADAKATAAKINPSQLSAADLSNGISNFSKMSEAVEKAKDVISILPKYREKPQDKVDYTIWQIINYCRRLQNLPDVKYADIYAFMDEQYGKQKELIEWLTKERDGHYDQTGEE